MKATEFLSAMAGKDTDPDWAQFVNDWHDTTVSMIVDGQAGRWRTGQLLMNSLCYVRPDMYGFVSGKPCDPFYRDERLPEFGRVVYDKFVQQVLADSNQGAL